MNNGHQLYSLKPRHDTHALVRASLREATDLLKAQTADMTRWHDLYKVAGGDWCAVLW